MDLASVVLIPVAVPPHKPGAVCRMAPARDRMEMIRRAVAGCPGFEVSDVELNRSGPSYTIDTVEFFRRTLPQSSELYFILGIDAFLEIDTWKSFRELLQRVPLVVVSRPGSGLFQAGAAGAALQRFVRERISDRYRPADDGIRLVHPEKQAICFTAVSPADVSSSRIRERIRTGGAIDGMVPESVRQYIAEKRLYQ